MTSTRSSPKGQTLAKAKNDMKKKGRGKVGPPKPMLENTKVMKDHPVGDKNPGKAAKKTMGKGKGGPKKKK